MFYCTKLDWTAREILSAYACRWAIECTFENCKQFLGLEDPANRLPKAVVRTAPMALFIYTLIVIWFHQTGASIATFSVPALVHQEGRTIVRRYVDDPEAGQLPGKNPTTASRTVWPENLDRPGHRASQPNRVSDTSTEDPASSTSSRSIRRGEFHPPGRSRTPSKSTKRELRGTGSLHSCQVVSVDECNQLVRDGSLGTLVRAFRTPDEQHSRWQEAAYYNWIARGRPIGDDLRDWLDAEPLA